MKIARALAGALLAFGLMAGVARAAGSHGACPDGVDPTASAALVHMTIVPGSQSCATHESHGFPLPDPHCTPGATNPTVDVATLRDASFRTSCERDQATSAAQKATTYHAYSLPHPAHNQGATQTCELDHLISLELGGADTLDNIWPQCGPDAVTLNARYFKQKDNVENYLAAMVKAGTIDIAVAQRGIAEDWTQFLDDAKAWAASNGHSHN